MREVEGVRTVDGLCSRSRAAVVPQCLLVEVDEVAVPREERGRFVSWRAATS